MFRSIKNLVAGPQTAATIADQRAENTAALEAARKRLADLDADADIVAQGDAATWRQHVVARAEAAGDIEALERRETALARAELEAAEREGRAELDVRLAAVRVAVAQAGPLVEAYDRAAGEIAAMIPRLEAIDEEVRAVNAALSAAGRRDDRISYVLETHWVDAKGEARGLTAKGLAVKVKLPGRTEWHWHRG